MLNQIISLVNDIYDNSNHSLNLISHEIESAIVLSPPVSDVLRRSRQELALENQGSILNNDLVSRTNSSFQQRNNQTHFFITGNNRDIFPPPLSGENFLLKVPVEIPYNTIHLMIDNIPTGYYHQNKIDELCTLFSSNETGLVNIPLKIDVQRRSMFGSKTYISDEEKRLYLELRFLVFEKDYFIIFKKKKQYRYFMVALPKVIGDQNGFDTFLGTIHHAVSTNLTALTLAQCGTVVDGKNLIVSGAPGTGKSHYIKENFETDNNYLRITFHPEYTYNEFVGSLKPISIDGEITYDFVPGPFSKILKMAYDNQTTMYTMIIEEINRGNTAAIFGDVFQLLDRQYDGVSEYGIENEDLSKYLNLETTEIKLPANLNIVATMNSADQGVFLMDTAFKRRWNFKYLPISFDSEWHNELNINYNNFLISWKDFITCINNRLAETNINEDRHIGPYFMKEEEVNDFRSYGQKLFLYLWDDAARIGRDLVFKSELKTFSSLLSSFLNNEEIFNRELHESLLSKGTSQNAANQLQQGTQVFNQILNPQQDDTQHVESEIANQIVGSSEPNDGETQP